MCHRVVYASEDDIFKRQTTLVGEVIIAQKFHDFRNTHALLSRHKLSSLLGYRRMKTDSYMAIAIFNEAFQFVLNADTAHRYALRTPCPAVVGRENLRCSQNIVKVVHRLPLSHEHDICKFIHFGKRINLVQDVTSCQASLKALLSRLTEKTVHFAAHLTRNAKSGAVILGDIHRFYKLSACCGE